MFGDKKMGQKQNDWLTFPAKKQTLEFKTNIDVLARSVKLKLPYGATAVFIQGGRGGVEGGDPSVNAEMLK